jgi:hypothetical protein
MRKIQQFCFVLGLAALLSGCSGGGNSTPPLPATATGLTVTAVGASVNAGTAFNITANAVDGSGVAVPNYAGTVHFTSTDPQAVLPPDSKLNNGSGTFAVTLKTAGAQAISATDTGNAGLAGTFSMNVNPGTASQLSINVASAVTTGLAFNMTVSTVDAFGNPATSYSGTANFTSTDPQATLPPLKSPLAE